MAVEPVEKVKAQLCARCGSAFFTYTGLNMHIANTHLGGHYNPLNPPNNVRPLTVREWP